MQFGRLSRPHHFFRKKLLWSAYFSAFSIWFDLLQLQPVTIIVNWKMIVRVEKHKLEKCGTNISQFSKWCYKIAFWLYQSLPILKCSQIWKQFHTQIRPIQKLWRFLIPEWNVLSSKAWCPIISVAKGFLTFRGESKFSIIPFDSVLGLFSDLSPNPILMYNGGG